MLDTGTKRRIDTARDILVGKVPDPKSQVEQITIALIYKFMDDMDAESEELGGKRKFFAGEFARYGWAKLMRSGLGGNEILNLYAEAIARMPENPGIPLLFRSIFKNAYLPYRDPETLKMFLKVIDEFEYDHSERLGDAFEYLLSVLGSQGDAGQFRTPRHIIDFIVEIVDPKKDETVLDPACGTAGFLISSYKHILKASTDDKGRNTLTPDEKGRLAENFKGYDISPDMVRLSLVNMYLHGFADPHIFEYDTLSNQERWGEYADVILANPPFMSPKGGIKPHNRFSVQSKRSEVLFVDYMAEHLTPNGRAGIIVPEGIIFQSQNAYTQLRKMLVEDYLVAVVSLPAGVFNPYSGVKTSILILDKSLAKKASTIAFCKVEKDGYGLGAQRRALCTEMGDRPDLCPRHSDLPQARAEITEYLRRLRARESVESLQPTLGLVVPKEKSAANGDYNLSGERYREGVAKVAAWPMVRLDEVTRRVSGGTPAKDNSAFWSGAIPWVSPKDMKTDLLGDTEDHVSESAIGRSATTVVPAGTLLCVVRSGILKHTLPLALTGREMCFNQDIIALIPSDKRLDARYLLAALKGRSAQILEEGIKPGVTVQSFHSGFFSQFKIPLPPLEVQKEIVAEIEGYQKIIAGARAVLDNYRPHIPTDPDWPMVTLGELCEQVQYGLSVPLKQDGVGFKTFRMNELVDGKCVDRGDMKLADIPAEEFEKFRLTHGDILFNRTNSIEHVGRTAIFDLEGEYCFASYLIRLVVAKHKADPFFVNVFMNSDSFQQGIKQFASRAIGQSNINAKNLVAYSIPLPPLAKQKAIVAEIEAEQALVNANRELIARFEKKIRAALARVWGEDGPAPAEA